MKKKKQVDPDLKIMLAELEEVADKLGYKVRYEKGNFAGGYCILRESDPLEKESRLLVINSRNEAERRIIILAKSLKEIGINDIFVKPNVREIIEKESSRKITNNEEVTEAAETE